jgi:hypothetical protein
MARRCIVPDRHLSPEHPVSSPLERLRHRLLRRLRFLSCRERADPFHQIEAQPHPVPVRLACRQLPSRFVLHETVFGGVRGLSDVERRKRARLTRAGAREFDDVDAVGAG